MTVTVMVFPSVPLGDLADPPKLREGARAGSTGQPLYGRLFPHAPKPTHSVGVR